MDIVERLLSWLNYEPNDYIEPAIIDIKEAADEIERLRWKNAELESTSGLGRVLTKQAEEIKRLRKQVAELVDALQTINKWQPSSKTQPRQKIIDNMQFYAHLSIAKATGGE